MDAGQTARFTVEAVGAAPLAYAWYRGATALPGRTTSVLELLNVAPADAGAYHAVVSNSAGQVESRPARLTVNPSGGLLHGKDVNETNTGVPPGRVLTDVASTLVITEDWIRDRNGGSRVLQDRNFLSGAQLRVHVDGFTVQFCRFNGRSGFSVDPNGDPHYTLGKHISLLDCEFDGQHLNLGGDVAVGGSSLALERVHVRRWPRAMWIDTGDVRVENCYFHEETADGEGAHLENIYVAGGTNMVFRGNRLITDEIRLQGGSTLQTSASLAIYNEDWGSFPRLDGILVQDNWFESDGHFAMYGGAVRGKNAPFARNMVVKGNIFGRSRHARSGLSGPATCFDPSGEGNRWEKNTWGPWTDQCQAGDPAEGTPVDAPTPQ